MTESQKIKCPECGAYISVNDVLHAEIEIQIKKDYEEKNRKEKEVLTQKEMELSKKILELDEAKKTEEIRIANAISKQVRQKELDIQKRAKQEAETELKQKLDFLMQQNEEKEKKLQESRTAQLELMKEQEKLKEAKNAFEIEKQKELMNARAKIAAEEAQKAAEANENKNMQLQKTIEDMKKQIEEAQKKANQSSQQGTGEADELALEARLKSAFLFDDITEVSKGVNGSDIVQTVKTMTGQPCGKISWEVKHAQTWSDKWIDKLKEDKLRENSDIGVIVTSSLPKNVSSGEFHNGVWICSMSSAIILARALHSQLEAVSRERNLATGRDEKQQVLYEYISGNQFRQRVEAIIDVFKGLQKDLDQEKRVFKKRWATTEKRIDRMMDNILGMHGDLEGMIALPKIPSLELGFEDDNEETAISEKE